MRSERISSRLRVGRRLSRLGHQSRIELKAPQQAGNRGWCGDIFFQPAAEALAIRSTSVFQPTAGSRITRDHISGKRRYGSCSSAQMPTKLNKVWCCSPPPSGRPQLAGTESRSALEITRIRLEGLPHRSGNTARTRVAHGPAAQWQMLRSWGESLPECIGKKHSASRLLCYTCATL